MHVKNTFNARNFYFVIIGNAFEQNEWQNERMYNTFKRF